MEKALKYFKEAWEIIKSGNFFDETANQTFEYMLKTILYSPAKNQVKSEILKHLPKLLEQSKKITNPPPFLYIIISTKDQDFIHTIQKYMLKDFISSNGSENSAFQILNLVGILEAKAIPTDNFIDAVIKSINKDMDIDMVNATLSMLTITSPSIMHKILLKLVGIAKSGNKNFLKTYVKSNGKRAILELLSMKDKDIDINEILKTIK